jgi:hypothetical protein
MPGDGLVLEEGPVEAAPLQELAALQELLLHMAASKHPTTMYNLHNIADVCMVNIGKACSCHKERTRTKREGREAAVITVLADAGMGGGANSNDSTKSVVVFVLLFLFHGRIFVKTECSISQFKVHTAVLLHVSKVKNTYKVSECLRESVVDA